jgi:hypothetical protein
MSRIISLFSRCKLIFARLDRLEEVAVYAQAGIRPDKML